MGKKPDPAPATPAFSNPAFSKLATLRDAVPAGPPSAAVAPAASSRKPPEGPARAVVRLERTGRGGKEVTVIEKLDLPPKSREAWLKELKGSLGCGGTLEGDDLVIAGDQRERARAWLEKKGVRKISVG